MGAKRNGTLRAKNGEAAAAIDNELESRRDRKREHSASDKQMVSSKVTGS